MSDPQFQLEEFEAYLDPYRGGLPDDVEHSVPLRLLLGNAFETAGPNANISRELHENNSWKRGRRRRAGWSPRRSSSSSPTDSCVSHTHSHASWPTRLGPSAGQRPGATLTIPRPGRSPSFDSAGSPSPRSSRPPTARGCTPCTTSWSAEDAGSDLPR